MSLSLRCLCGTTFQVPEGKAGERGLCPSCGQVFVVPHPKAAPALAMARPPAAKCFKCVQCGRAFGIRDVVRYEGRVLCRECLNRRRHLGSGTLVSRKVLLIGAGAAVAIAVIVPLALYGMRSDRTQPAPAAPASMVVSGAPAAPAAPAKAVPLPPAPVTPADPTPVPVTRAPQPPKAITGVSATPKKEPAVSAVPTPPAASDGTRLLRHNLVARDGHVWQTRTQRAIEMRMRQPAPDGSQVSLTIKMDVDGESALRLDSAAGTAGGIHAVWRPQNQLADLTFNLAVSTQGTSTSGTGKGHIEILPTSGSGWVEAGDEPRRAFEQAELEQMRAVAGIGGALAVDLTPQGRVLEWQASGDLGGKFDREAQRQLVALVSGVIVPVFPDTPVQPGDGWRVTPGSKDPPILKGQRAVSLREEEEILREKITHLSGIMKGPTGGEQGDTSLLSFSEGGGILNPFGWGLPLDYVHAGYVTGDGGRRNVKLQYTANVKNPKIDWKDNAIKVSIQSITVNGETLFDPERGAVVSSTSQWQMELTLSEVASGATADVSVTATTDGAWRTGP